MSEEEFRIYGQFMAARDAIRGSSDTEDEDYEDEDSSESDVEGEDNEDNELS